MARLQNTTRTLAAVAALFVVIGAAATGANAQGSLVAWGDDSGGMVSGAPSGTFVAVAAGASWVGSFAVAIRANGTLAPWGGYGLVSGAPTGTFTSVATNGGHAVAIRSDGTLAAWGADGNGQVSGPNAATGTFVAVATGLFHTVAIRSDGTLIGWGYDGYGQVSGPNTDGGTFVAVACDEVEYGNTAAIRTNGTIASWGTFSSGYSIPPAGTFSAISLSAEFGAALRTDGSLVLWSAGAGGAFESPGPYRSVDNDYWGTSYPTAGTILAIRSDGTLAAWGDDSSGQLSNLPGGTYTAIATSGGICFAIATPSGNQPPVITCNGPVALWLPNHELVDVSSAISVSDPDGNPVTLTFRVFSDETEIPDTGDGTGRHAPDFKTVLGSGATGIFLRSERRATGNGRYYVAVVTADDGNGGVTQTACVLAVCPRDQTPQSLNDVLSQAALTAAQVQSLVDAEALPTPGQAPTGMSEHGLAAPMGPFQ